MIFLLLLAKALVTAATATAVVATIVAITYSAIKEWYEPRVVSSDTVEAIKRELPNAVVVTIGIRSKDGIWKETKDFEGNALSDDMKAKFAGRDRIILKG